MRAFLEPFICKPVFIPCINKLTSKWGKIFPTDIPVSEFARSITQSTIFHLVFHHMCVITSLRMRIKRQLTYEILLYVVSEFWRHDKSLPVSWNRIQNFQLIHIVLRIREFANSMPYIHYTHTYTHTYIHTHPQTYTHTHPCIHTTIHTISCCIQMYTPFMVWFSAFYACFSLYYLKF